jgi:hypothetical protein
MPEAAVDEKADAAAGKNKVRLSRQRPDVQAKP